MPQTIALPETILIKKTDRSIVTSPPRRKTHSKRFFSGFALSLAFWALALPADAAVERMTKAQIQRASINVAKVVCFARRGFSIYKGVTTSSEALGRALQDAGIGVNSFYAESDHNAITANAQRLLDAMNSDCELTRSVRYIPPAKKIYINGIPVQCTAAIANCEEIAPAAFSKAIREIEEKYAYCRRFYQAGSDVNQCVRSL